MYIVFHLSVLFHTAALYFLLVVCLGNCVQATITVHIVVDM